MHPSFAKLYHVFHQVHQDIVASKQTVTQQEAQVATKVSDEVGGAVDEELLLHWKLILGEVDSGVQFTRVLGKSLGATSVLGYSKIICVSKHQT